MAQRDRLCAGEHRAVLLMAETVLLAPTAPTLTAAPEEFYIPSYS